MAKTVRLKDIADKIGVSTVTVSKALSGQRGMSEELREKIHAMADDMGYVPSVSRKQDFSSKSYTIGVLISENFMSEYSSFYTRMHQQVSQIAMDKGCFTMLEVISVDHEKNKVIPRLVEDKKIDGIVVVGRLDHEYLRAIKDISGIPMVYLDFCNHTGDEDAVVSDSYNGAYCLTNYLFDMGHKDIAFVGTLLASGAITDRYLGYTKSLMEHGRPFRGDWIIPDRDLETGVMDINKYFELPEQMPTAFFCNCDMAASMMIKKLREKGYRVPEDISVVGYDNYLFPGLCDIKITTYGVDSYEMGRNAILNLIRKISGERYRQGIMILEGHMIEGESVKRLD
ncbi:substrate-binding domain-containing protein [Butyrivibrio sp. YAB3001]|uniref:substrate-binding domain-containing protein n=1 Tax=Butyrivibrio sp. YAB3001 TaxID=1520812 RepID=UPI0008F67A16|nr:substrate-binding domain-containing protein [Butyrivibrio sp. YAB3001]SFB72323.1 LacI family transcriptional regulator, purine nucleotide synthesis repressor [Butyrivibrio sp. YAB3001]